MRPIFHLCEESRHCFTTFVANRWRDFCWQEDEEEVYWLGCVMSIHFGEHLTIDGYGGKKEKLSDKELVLRCLTELPKILEMHVLMEPAVIWAEPSGRKDPGGWSGFVIIAESHISIHTFPGRRFLSADVYTCRNGVDVQKIIAYFSDTFALSDVEEHFIKRGERYPEHDVD